MDTIDLGKLNTTNDPVLQKQVGYSVEPAISGKRPELFTKIDEKIIKSVALYLQLLLDANSNGMIISVFDLIHNSKNLFGTKFESKDTFVNRHIASDLREIFLSSSPTNLKKYYKIIDTERQDIASRLKLISSIKNFFSEIVHLRYEKSLSYLEEISISVKELENETIDIPENFDKYVDPKRFDEIFESVCIIYIFNFYKIFSEFLYNEKE